MKLTNDDAIKILKNYRKDSFGPNDNELTTDRAEALDRYHGRPYGDEEEGYSQFVTRDLSEAVDWAIPSIMRPFIQSGVLAEFRPDSQDDEDQVEIESSYVNYVIMEDNSGFILLHDAIKDALILRNGYVKHWWDESKEVTERSWKGVSELETAHIWKSLKDDNAEITIKEVDVTENGNFDLTAKIVTKSSGVKLMAVPPEELRVANTCRGSLQESDYVGHIPRKTRSDLIAMGIPKQWLDSLNDDGQTDSSTESDKRDSTNEEKEYSSTDVDKSMQKMDYAEEYVRMDFDGDGIAELRKIITVNNQIPPGDEWNVVIDAIPFTGGVPKRMPHRHIGESFQDDLKDLAEQHTTLVRQMFDNVYRTNNNQWAINDRVDEGEFLDQGPSAVFNVDGKEPVDGSIKAITHDSIAQHLLPVISYVEEKKKKRTGVNDGDLDPDILMKATKGAFLEDLNRKSQKIEMTTRMLGETLIKEMVINVHALVVKHQHKTRNVKLGGEYVDIKASTWKPRKNVTVKVGLGTGNTEERMRKLTMLKGLQSELINMGLVTEEEAYALYVDIAKELGETNPEKYVITPDKQNPKYQQVMQRRQSQGQQPNPLAEAEKIKGQFSVEKEKMRLNFKFQSEEQQRKFDAAFRQMNDQHAQVLETIKANQAHEHNMHELIADSANKAAKLMSDEAIAAFNGEVKALIEGFRIDAGKPGLGAGLQDE